MILHRSLRSSNAVRGTLSKSAAVHLHRQRMLLLRAFVLLHVVVGGFDSVDVDFGDVDDGNALVASTIDAFANVTAFDGDSIGLDRVLV